MCEQIVSGKFVTIVVGDIFKLSEWTPASPTFPVIHVGEHLYNSNGIKDCILIFGLNL